MFDKIESLTLSESEKGIKLVDANLEQFSKAINKNETIEEKIIAKFFNGVQFKELSYEIGLYKSNIFQYSFIKFLNLNGFKLVNEIGLKDSQIITKAKKSSVEYDKGAYFSNYLNALLFFEKEETGEKILYRIEKNEYSSDKYYYTVFDSIKDDNFITNLEAYVNENNFYKGKKITPDCVFLDVPKHITWDDVILDSKTKTLIKNNVENLIKIKDILNKNKINLKRGIILSGPPGTGKTMICKVLSNELPVTVLYVLPTHIKDKSDVTRICDMAKSLSPTVLILEDIDYIAEDRDSGNNWIVIDLMNKLDGLEEFNDVITVATTNKVDKLEDAVKNRPGRFDRVINIPNPDVTNRKNMIEKFIKHYECDDSLNVEVLADSTESMSGAFIKDLCTTAVMHAIYENSLNKEGIAELTANHFKKALKELHNKDYSTYEQTKPKERIGFG